MGKGVICVRRSSIRYGASGESPYCMGKGVICVRRSSIRYGASGESSYCMGKGVICVRRSSIRYGASGESSYCMGKGVICVDLFCGCGGLPRGLRDAGIRVAKGVDWDKTAMETYERNNPGSVFMLTDLRDVSADEIMESVDRRGRDLLLAGCALCQPFSKHAISAGSDERRSLIQCMGRLVKEILPEYVLMENVPGFGKDANTHRTDFMNVLRGSSYNVVSATDYGVPQTRRRYVILASRKGKISIPQGPGIRDNPRTVRGTISRFSEIGAGESDVLVPNHTSLNLSPENLKRMRLTPKDGGSRQNTPESMWIECHMKHAGHTDTYGRMRWDRPLRMVNYLS